MASLHADSTSSHGVILVTVRNPSFDRAGALAGEAVTLRKLVATGPNGDHFQRDHRDPGPYAEKVHAVVILGNDHDRA
jgi:hypothetical protein